MSEFTTAIIVGSLRKASLNLKLAKALIKLGQGHFKGTVLPIDDLPLFNQDLEADFPAPATRLKQAIEQADSVLIVTPEYNRSVPGPLKNAIDWASRPYGKNAFKGKPTSIVGTSPGAVGTACAQMALRPVMIYLDVKLLGQPEIFLQFKDSAIDDDGNIGDEKLATFLKGHVETFAKFVTAAKA